MGPMMQLRHDYRQVREATDASSFEEAMVSFANRLDFSTISAIMVVERVKQPTQYLSIGNTPEAFKDVYNSAEDASRDPVLRRLRKLNAPMVWDQQTYVEGGAADLWEKQAPYDYHTGIGMALHLPMGRHFFLGVDRRAALPSDEERLDRMMADLQLLAVYAQDTAQRIFDVGDNTAEAALTAREVEVLRWTVLGKTAGEIAQILGTSEHTVHWHAQRALRKLGCENKHAAAMRARELGLI